MPPIKIIFTILLLVLRDMPSFKAYRYGPSKLNDWESMLNLYDDDTKYYGDYGRLDRSVNEFDGFDISSADLGEDGGYFNDYIGFHGGTDHGTATGTNTGGGTANGGGGGGGGGAASASAGGCNNEGETEEAKACTSKATKCNASFLGRGDSKMTASAYAQKAAQEAKAANDAQVPAAEAASFQAKCELAGKAIESAKAVEAVLAGKQEMLDAARMELTEAEKESNRLIASMGCVQENANLANNAVADIQTVLSHVKNVLHEAAKNVASLQCVAKGALQELTEKHQILKAAKFRAANLNRQLTEAKADFDKTKMAAYKAVCAAVEAKQKAQRSRRMSWLYLDDLEEMM